jgi:hypothetical protein
MKSNRTFYSIVSFIFLLLVMQGCSSDSKPTVTLKGTDSSSSSTTTLTALDTGTIDASSLKLKVYKFAVSESEKCTHPITIFTSADGEEKDIATGPTFGAGTVDSATYPCVMIEMSKTIKTTPSTSSGSCVAGHEFSDVICNDGQESQLIDGTAVTCSGGDAHNQHVVAYITTLRLGAGGDRALLPPTSSADAGSGIILTAPFVVDGDVTGTLSVSLHNFLGSASGECFTSPPPFTFE